MWEFIVASHTLLIFKMFQVHNMIVQHLCTLQCDHCHKSSYCPSPHGWLPPPFSPTCHPTPSFVITTNLCSVSMSVFCFFCGFILLVLFFTCTYEWNHIVIIILFLFPLASYPQCPFILLQMAGLQWLNTLLL